MRLADDARLLCRCAALTWSPGWRRRSTAPAQHLRSPSRFPATSFPPSALDRRPGIGWTSRKDSGKAETYWGKTGYSGRQIYFNASTVLLPHINELKRKFLVHLRLRAEHREWSKTKQLIVVASHQHHTLVVEENAPCCRPAEHWLGEGTKVDADWL